MSMHDAIMQFHTVVLLIWLAVMVYNAWVLNWVHRSRFRR